MSQFLVGVEMLSLPTTHLVGLPMPEMTGTSRTETLIAPMTGLAGSMELAQIHW